MSQGHCRNWRKYLWLPLVLFSTSYLSSPGFPPCMQTTASSHHTAPAIICYKLFFAFPFFFFFTGSDQENVWERRLPIGAGEWHSAVRVSTPPVLGTPLQPATRAVVCFPRGLDFCVSVADISQTDLRLGRCWFVVPVKWQDSRGSSVPRRLEWDLPSVLGFNEMKLRLF